MEDQAKANPPAEVKKEPPGPIWYDEKPKEWKVTSYNFRGKVDVIPGSKNIWEYLTPIIEEANKQFLSWSKYNIWVGHEQILQDFIFDDVNYLREPDGWIRFVAEQDMGIYDDHSRRRPVLAQIFEEKICVVCKNKETTKIMPCLHVCLCEDCYPKQDKCPICRKRKLK